MVEMTEEMREFFRKTGAEGAKKRKEMYSNRDFSKWGKKGSKAQKKKHSKAEFAKWRRNAWKARKRKPPARPTSGRPRKKV